MSHILSAVFRLQMIFLVRNFCHKEFLEQFSLLWHCSKMVQPVRPIHDTKSFNAEKSSLPTQLTLITRSRCINY